MSYKVVKTTERKYYKYKSVANGYRELTFVDFTNQPLLDTGIACNSNLKMIFDFIPREITGDVILGDFSGSDNEDYRFFNWDNMIFFDMGSARIYGSRCYVDTRYKLEFGNYYVKEYGASSNLLQGNTQTYSSAYTVKIMSSVTFCSLQMYYGNTFVGDFVPCERISDNVVGLYNKITDEFITVTSGNAIKGNYIIEESTEQDYDFYEDVDIYKVVQKTERKYYKNWTQPILTGNNSNPDFVISANVNEGDAYVSFDGIKSNAGWGPKGSAGSFSGLTSWCQMTCSDAINITKITITNRNPGDNTNQAIMSGSWQVSEDGINWITVNNWTNNNTIFGSSWDINLNYSGFYRYNRLYVYSGTTTASGNWICVGEVELTARTKGTSSDYDYYEDVPIYKAIQKLISN